MGKIANRFNKKTQAGFSGAQSTAITSPKVVNQNLLAVFERSRWRAESGDNQVAYMSAQAVTSGLAAQCARQRKDSTGDGTVLIQLDTSQVPAVASPEAFARIYQTPVAVDIAEHDADSILALRDAIDEALQNDWDIFVHCTEGQMRSPAVAEVIYMVSKGEWVLADGLDRIGSSSSRWEGARMLRKAFVDHKRKALTDKDNEPEV